MKGLTHLNVPLPLWLGSAGPFFGHPLRVFALLALLVPAVIHAQTPTTVGQASSAEQQQGISEHYDPDDSKTYADVVSEDRRILVHGHQLLIHYYKPNTTGAMNLAIYACGDGGWRGLAPRTAEELAHRGFVVAGVDSKVYLRDFSSVSDPLTVARLAADYVDIARALRLYAGQNPNTRVYVYGWSLGAGFAVAVGSDLEHRDNWAGIVSIGLPRQNQLVSGVGGNHVNLGSVSKGSFGFRTENLIASISPLPLAMIQSTSDTASPPNIGRLLFSVAREPKQLIVLKASNHRFSGAREEFYSTLVAVVPWMRETSKRTNAEAAKISPSH